MKNYKAEMPHETVKEISKIIKESKDSDELELDMIKIHNFTNEIVKVIESVEDLGYLTLNTCEIKSLANFPKLTNLVHLELSNNDICSKELVHLKCLKGLQSLILSNNNITKIEDLKVLGELPELIQLDLTGNPVTELKEYRTEVYKMIKSLQFLDKLDAEGKVFEYTSEEEYDDEENEDSEDDDEDDEDEDDENDDEDDEEEDDEGEEEDSSQSDK